MKLPKEVLDELKGCGLKTEGKWFKSSSGHMMAYCSDKQETTYLVTVAETTLEWLVEILKSHSVIRVSNKG